jgi:hypothetical protein
VYKRQAEIIQIIEGAIICIVLVLQYLKLIQSGGLKDLLKRKPMIVTKKEEENES